MQVATRKQELKDAVVRLDKLHDDIRYEFRNPGCSKARKQQLHTVDAMRMDIIDVWRKAQDARKAAINDPRRNSEKDEGVKALTTQVLELLKEAERLFEQPATSPPTDTASESEEPQVPNTHHGGDVAEVTRAGMTSDDTVEADFAKLKEKYDERPMSGPPPGNGRLTRIRKTLTNRWNDRETRRTNN